MATMSSLDPRPVLGDTIRVFNKHVLNPLMLQLAGRRHWYAARLEHVGRRSGRRFATPVVVSAVPGGFVVPLPYGTHVDWVRNLAAAGGGALVVDGRRWTITDPEVHATAGYRDQLPRREQLRSSVWHIGHYLRVSAVPEPPAGDERRAAEAVSTGPPRG